MLNVSLEELKNGTTQKIGGIVEPGFLEEKEFSNPIKIEGISFIVSDFLVLELNIETSATLPCSICNNLTKVEIKIEKIIISEAVESIENSIFNYSIPLREAILLETPFFTECKGGCKERKEVEKHMKNGKKYFPFAELSEKDYNFPKGEKNNGRPT